MNYTELLAFIIILILAGTTLQLVVIKNNIDRKWNDKFGHSLGNYCFLCVSFWVNFIIVGWYAILGNDVSVLGVAMLVSSVPAGIMFLLKR